MWTLGLEELINKHLNVLVYILLVHDCTMECKQINIKTFKILSVPTPLFLLNLFLQLT